MIYLAMVSVLRLGKWWLGAMCSTVFLSILSSLYCLVAASSQPISLFSLPPPPHLSLSLSPSLYLRISAVELLDCSQVLYQKVSVLWATTDLFYSGYLPCRSSQLQKTRRLWRRRLMRFIVNNQNALTTHN